MKRLKLTLNIGSVDAKRLEIADQPLLEGSVVSVPAKAATELLARSWAIEVSGSVEAKSTK